jgi:2-dehydro-3-deoxyphosphogluconate aldolase / (4S)-4-hydroxy-2-oxoglutarate aldolase
VTVASTSGRVYDAVRRSRLVAILRASDAGALVAGAEVLVDEGVTTLELPLTSPGALDALARAVEALSDRAIVGAGTVRTVDDARRAIDAGARFLVAPALSVPVVEHALAHGVAALPGVMTPTDYETARAAGAELVKLFPAQTLGPSYLAQLRVPFPELEAVPTAGIGLEDCSDWFAAGAVAIGVGSPLTGRFLEEGDLDGLRLRARAWKAALP